MAAKDPVEELHRVIQKRYDETRCDCDRKVGEEGIFWKEVVSCFALA